MDHKYQVKNGFLKRTIAGEILLVPVGATTQDFNGMIMLNDSASYMWDLLKKPMAKEELVAEMGREFDAPADVISADVDEFLENGVREGLIQEL